MIKISGKLKTAFDILDKKSYLLIEQHTYATKVLIGSDWLEHSEIPENPTYGFWGTTIPIEIIPNSCILSYEV